MKQLLISIIFVSFAAGASPAQWKTAVANDHVLVFAVHDTSLFASILAFSNGRNQVFLYVPSNNGWVERDNGLDFSQGNVTSFASLGSNFLAGLGGDGSYRTKNNGLSWQVNGGSPVVTNGTYFYSSGTSTTFRSRDSGNTWQPVGCPVVSAFGAIGSCILGANINGLWRSTDSGTKWAKITPLAGLSLSAFSAVDTLIFAGGAGVFRSVDSGANWQQIGLKNRTVVALATSRGHLFAGTDSGVFVSDDTGKSWHAENYGLGTFLSVNALTVFDTMLFVNVTTPIQFYTAMRPISEMIPPKSGVQAVASVPIGDTLEVYPNPASGLVTIRYAGGTAISWVTVLNVLGDNVIEVPNGHSSELTVDLSHFASGTYFLRIATANGIVMRKVVRE